jgi:hypothetical protein
LPEAAYEDHMLSLESLSPMGSPRKQPSQKLQKTLWMKEMAIENSCVVLEKSKKNTSNEVDKARASSSMIKASEEALAQGGKEKSEGEKEKGEEGSTELPSSRVMWVETVFRES